MKQSGVEQPLDNVRKLDTVNKKCLTETAFIQILKPVWAPIMAVPQTDYYEYDTKIPKRSRPTT